MPAPVTLKQFGNVAAIGPRFASPMAVLDDADHVHEPPGGNQVVDAVSAGPHPVVRRHLDIEVSDAFGRHQPTPCHAAGEARLFGPTDNVAHATVNTVGTDQ